MIRSFKPDLVITQSPERNYARIFASHPDHLATGRGDAARGLPRRAQPPRLPRAAARGLRAAHRRHGLARRRSAPTMVVDITKTIEQQDRRAASATRARSATARTSAQVHPPVGAHDGEERGPGQGAPRRGVQGRHHLLAAPYAAAVAHQQRVGLPARANSGRASGARRRGYASSSLGAGRENLPVEILAGVTLLAIADARAAGHLPAGRCPGLHRAHRVHRRDARLHLLGSNPIMSVGADSTIAPLFSVALLRLALPASAPYLTLVAATAVVTGVLVAAVGLARIGLAGRLPQRPDRRWLHDRDRRDHRRPPAPARPRRRRRGRVGGQPAQRAGPPALVDSTAGRSRWRRSRSA